MELQFSHLVTLKPILNASMKWVTNKWRTSKDFRAKQESQFQAAHCCPPLKNALGKNRHPFNAQPLIQPCCLYRLLLHSNSTSSKISSNAYSLKKKRKKSMIRGSRGATHSVRQTCGGCDRLIYIRYPTIILSLSLPLPVPSLPSPNSYTLNPNPQS